jgi:hypothetical protein
MRYRASAALPVLVVIALAVPASAAAPQTDRESAAIGASQSAKSWIGREDEFEEYLEHAEVVDLEPIGIGVTNPYRARLAPGGPVDMFAWKPIRPGKYHGHYESYESEVAAYQLDRLLELGMVPVTVERRVGRNVGAACMWVSPAKSFRELGGPPKPPARHAKRWNIQLVRAKMFDNLIHNKDPNLGNWLVDPDWNLVLIDHSRAFTSDKRMAHKMTRVDRDLWERMKRLDEETLTAALGESLSRVKIRAILKRRDRMAQEIEELVAVKGETAVLLRYIEPER